MKKIILCLLVSLFFASPSLFSQNEFLDQTFGVNGIIFQQYTDTIAGSNLESDFGTIVLQSDGKIITASNFHQHGPNQRYVINRYSTDGTLDPTFGTNGFAVSDLDNSIGSIQLQPDGKIIGFASEGDFYSSFSYLFRYNADGSIDDSFGINGTVIDTVNTITSCSIQLNDKIVITKIPVYFGFSPNFKIVRYNLNGMLDISFGNNGEIDVSLAQLNIFLQDVVIQNDGKIVIRGSIRSDDVDRSDILLDDRSDILLLRFNSDGSPDTTFGEEGIKIFNYDYYDESHDILIQTDGKIIFSSSSSGLLPGVEGTKRIVRLNADGNLDATFGIGGIKMIAYPILRVLSLKQLPNGKLIVSGIYETSVNPAPGDNETPAAVVIARYNTNGDLDLDFGQNGYIITTINNSRALNDKLVVQPDGKILVGATFCESWFSCHPHAVVLRYDPGGELFNPEFDKNPAFLLYPNPVRETVTIDFNLQQSEVLSMDLYSSDGRKVANLLKDQNFQTGHNSQKLNFPGTLADGIYFLSVSNEKNTTIIKIVK